VVFIILFILIGYGFIKLYKLSKPYNPFHPTGTIIDEYLPKGNCNINIEIRIRDRDEKDKKFNIFTVSKSDTMTAWRA